jgi:hypothetical protein
LCSALLAQSLATHAAVLSVCDEATLRAAVEAGGTITFSCDGMISLTQTLVVSNEVVLDGTGHQVIISGRNQLRLFEVYAALTLIRLTLADGFDQGQPAHSDNVFVPGKGGPAAGPSAA